MLLESTHYGAKHSKVKDCVCNKATVSLPAESLWHKWENKDLKWLLFT